MIFILTHVPPASAVLEAVPPTPDKSLNVIRGFDRDHLGIDISAEIGAPIKAIASGNISWVGSLPNGLRCVSIEHGNGLRTTYMPVRLDDTLSGWRSSELRVGTGGHIGFLEDGDGSSSEPHLHLGLKTGHGNGEQYFDPIEELNFLKYKEITETDACSTDASPVCEEYQPSAAVPCPSDLQIQAGLKIPDGVEGSTDPSTSVKENYVGDASGPVESAQVIAQQQLPSLKRDQVEQKPVIPINQTSCALSPSSTALSSPAQSIEKAQMVPSSSASISTDVCRPSRFERIQQISNLRQLSDVLDATVSAVVSTYRPMDGSLGNRSNRDSEKASPVTASTLFLLAVTAICISGLKSAVLIFFATAKAFKSGTTTRRYVVRPPPMPV